MPDTVFIYHAFHRQSCKCGGIYEGNGEVEEDHLCGDSSLHCICRIHTLRSVALMSNGIECIIITNGYVCLLYIVAICAAAKWKLQCDLGKWQCCKAVFIMEALSSCAFENTLTPDLVSFCIWEEACNMSCGKRIATCFETRRTWYTPLRHSNFYFS